MKSLEERCRCTPQNSYYTMRLYTCHHGPVTLEFTHIALANDLLSYRNVDVEDRATSNRSGIECTPLHTIVCNQNWSGARLELAGLSKA